MKILEQLLNYWGNNRNKGLSEKQVQKILNKKNIVLPEDFKDLYSRANGNKDQDDEAFRFFSLNENEGPDLYKIIIWPEDDVEREVLKQYSN